MDYTKLFISNSEIRSLRRVRRKKPIRLKNAEFLRKCGMVEIVRPIPPLRVWICRMTDHGNRYLDHVNRARSDRRWTRALSIIAILISIAALYVSILSI